MDDREEERAETRPAHEAWEGCAFVIVATPFQLGQPFLTPGAKAALEALPEDGDASVASLLARHLGCDWGDLDEEDKAANDRAARNGNQRILSAYTLSDGTRLWIITEADRSLTTLLLPDEY